MEGVCKDPTVVGTYDVEDIASNAIGAYILFCYNNDAAGISPDRKMTEEAARWYYKSELDFARGNWIARFVPVRVNDKWHLDFQSRDERIEDEFYTVVTSYGL